MSSLWSGPAIRRVAAAGLALLIALPVSFAQTPADPVSDVNLPDTQPAAPLMPPEQLDNLVAPIALYPDPLLSQVLAASTYPLEIVEAQQWLRQNGNLRGRELMDAARQQNWDSSIQALVAFPDALGLLSNDVRWTTDLGNAFLAQESDVMDAVQRMRARARDNGRLNSSPQQEVRMATEDGQSAIEILPADPQVVYVPTYNPAYVWGPPIWGAYPDLWYPAGYGWEFGFGPGIYVGTFFPGWAGWGGWGWGCGWYGRSVFLNNGFFHRYGFRGDRFGWRGGASGRGFGGRANWSHDPGHRHGIPYPNRATANRFNSSRFGSSRFTGDRFSGGRFASGGRSGGDRWNGQRFDSNRSGASPLNRRGFSGGTAVGRSSGSSGWRSFGGSDRSSNVRRPDAGGRYSGSYRQSSPGDVRNGGSRSYRSPAQSNSGRAWSRSYSGSPSFGRTTSPSYSAPSSRGFSSPRSFSAPSRSYSAPSRSFSAPSHNFSAPSRSYSAPTRNFSAPSRSFSAPSHSFSAPSRSSSAPRSFSSPHSSGGNSGPSGGYSGGSRGSSGGHSGGGGRHR